MIKVDIKKNKSTMVIVIVIAVIFGLFIYVNKEKPYNPPYEKIEASSIILGQLMRGEKSSLLLSANVAEVGVGFGIEKDGQEFLVVPVLDGVDKQVKLKRESNKILYQGVYPGIDIEYLLFDGHIKENIIIKNREAKKEFIFDLKKTFPQASKVSIRNDEGILISFIDENNGEELFTLDQPIAHDDAGFPIPYHYKVEGEKLILEVHDEKDWKKNIRYPVVIGSPMTTREYDEVLVKVGQNGNETGNAKDGDVTNIESRGWKWGEDEYKKFVIVRVPKMTKQEREEFSSVYQSSILFEQDGNKNLEQDKEKIKNIENAHYYGIDYVSLLANEKVKAFKVNKDFSENEVPTQGLIDIIHNEVRKNPIIDATNLDVGEIFKKKSWFVALEKKGLGKGNQLIKDESIIPKETRLAGLLFKNKFWWEKLISTAEALDAKTIGTTCGGSCDYSTIQSWEDGEDGVLTETERGDVYNDKTYAENITFSGSTTDADNYMYLTVPIAERHNGTAGTGVKLDPSSSGHAFYVRDQYTVIEGFEITGLAGTSDEGVRLGASNNEADYTSLRYLLIHDLNTSQQDGVYTGIWDVFGVSIENTIMYDIARAGIHMQMYQDSGLDQDINLRNVTIYNANTQNDGGGGIHIFASDSSSIGIVNATNTIVMGTNYTSDFSVAEASGTQTFNLYNCMSEDGTADDYNGSGNLVSKVIADQFTSVTAGSEDLRLKTGSDAIDAGLDVSAYLNDDIEGDARPQVSGWDIGADEFIPSNYAPTITSVTDSPDSQSIGGDIEFSVDWNDVDSGDSTKIKICKTDSLTGQNCDGGSWASSTVFTTTDPEVISYTTDSSDVGGNAYYVFACDEEAACSDATSGVFDVNPDWWNSSWGYRKKIILDNTDQTLGHTDFPVMVTSTSADTDFWSHVADGADDVRFVNDDGAELYFELEDWNSTSDNMLAWVKKSFVNATTTDAIWMYYGNDSAATSTSLSAANVWDSNYKMVWHMNEGSGTLQDSTSNNMDSSAVGGATYSVSSPTGDGIGLADGYTSSYLRRSTDSDIGQDPFTWEMWFEINVITDTTYWLLEMNGGQFDMHINDGTSYDFGTSHDDLSPSYTSYTDGGFNFAVDTWYHVVGTKYTSGDDRVKVYKDGDLFYEDGGTNAPAGTITWGNFDFGYHGFGGTMDEIRISAGTRSADWIAFEYCNMTGSCTTYGSEEVPNSRPTISSASDSPDPIGVGSLVTFSIDWADDDTGDLQKVYVCKTDVFSSGCTGGEWTASENYGNKDPMVVDYTTQAADKGSSQNYYVYVCDNSGSGSACTESGTSGSFTVQNMVPDAPTSLLVEGMDSVAGQAFNLTDTTPEFSMVYNDSNDQGDQANKYCIEVNTQNDFAGTSMWVSDGANCYTGSTMTAIDEGDRSSDQTYAGTTLNPDGTKYYWRSWLWDDDGERSVTSTIGWFQMADSASGSGIRLKGTRLNGGVRLK
jgi:hypothetical protein